MSASNVPPVPVDCDYHIREATGGWILHYASGTVPCRCEDPDCVGIRAVYDERIFTESSDLTAFLLERMVEFKTFRSRNTVNNELFTSFANAFDTAPEPPKGGCR